MSARRYSLAPVMAVALLAFSALAVLACGTVDQTTETSSEVATAGDEMSAEFAPDFTLPDANAAPGSNISLSQFRGDKPVVLVFYRAYW